MSHFVIGVSGVTCGGKTTLAKLVQRTIPWANIIHQDAYFFPDDDTRHVRLPELDNHVDYDATTALDMPAMESDLRRILEAPPMNNGAKKSAPNFQSGDEFLNSVPQLRFDVSEFLNVPIIIVEGFTIYSSEGIHDACDVRIFLTLDEATCHARRLRRAYDPPDCPGYFEAAVWPRYEAHLRNDILSRSNDIRTFNGTRAMDDIWSEAMDLIMCGLRSHINKKVQCITKD